jgi:hypothetical protein
MSKFHTSICYELLQHTNYPSTSEPQCEATPIEVGSPPETICAGFVDICFPILHSIYVSQFFIPFDLRAEFPTRATRGTGVVGTSAYPSIPNTTVNVMRP